MSETGEQGKEEEQDEGEGVAKRKQQVPRRDVVNFYFTNFPSDWNKVNLHDLFAEVGEIANVYVAKKVSKTGHKFGFARFFRVGNIQALENRLNRIMIGTFKLRANIARFDRYHSRCKQGSKKVDWVFDIPSKSNQIPCVKLSPSNNQNGRLKALVGESFFINSPSELQKIWKSLNVKDCKVTLMDGQRIMLDFTSMEGYDSTNFFDAERHVEKGNKIDTKDVNNVFESFDGRSGENSSPIRSELHSVNVASATDLASPMGPPVSEVRDLNFESDVRTSEVTGFCSKDNDKSLSNTDIYCAGLDKVGLNCIGPANMDLKICVKQSDGGLKSGSFIHFKHSRKRNKFRYLHHIRRKALKHNASRLNLKWCRRAAFYEFIEEDSEYSDEDDHSEEDYDFDQNSRPQRRLSAQF